MWFVAGSLLDRCRRRGTTTKVRSTVLPRAPNVLSGHRRRPTPPAFAAVPNISADERVGALMRRNRVRSALSSCLVAVLVVALSLAWTAESVAVAPAAPTLLGPSDGASVTLPVTITWAPTSAPNTVGGYNWEVSRTAAFTSVIERNPVLVSGVATTEDVVSGLAQGSYFWRVQAVSRDLEPGVWSSSRSFTVTGAGPTAPAAPVLAPPSGATRFHPLETITFSWSAVPGAVSYVLQESTDPAFPVDTRVRQVNLPGTTERISLNSGNQGSFQARVLAVDAEGLMGLPSNLVSFSVQDSNPLPAAPLLQGPANGSAAQLPVALSWTDVPNHQDDGYQIQVSSSSSFTTIEKSFRSTENRLVVPTLTAGTKFWRVRSQHGYVGATEAYTAWSATGTFSLSPTPLRISTATFPARVFSGAEARGSLDLTGNAPSGGATVALSTDRPDLLPELPASRQVPAGSSSVPVLVAPTGFPNSLRGMRVGFVTSPTPVTLTATYNGTSASSTITLLPPTLNDTPLQLFPVKATGGADMTGIVDLEVGCFAGFCDGLAPPGGFPVSLSSSSPSATVPATFTIPAGAGGDSFPIGTSPVSRSTHVTITARAGGATAHWTLTLTPSPELDGVTLVPAQTSSTSQGQVTIPPSEILGHDQLVRVTSSNPAVASVPEFATVPASTDLARFDIVAHPGGTSRVVTITVTGGGVSRSAELTVSPSLPALTSLSVSPTSVPGGSTATGTVTLAGPAPAGGATVSLGSSLPGSASVPASVQLPGGATSATFPVTTSAVDNTTVQLTATLDSVTEFAALSITRAVSGLTGLSLSPTSVTGGGSTTGTVTLGSTAPAGGTVVTLSDDSSAATTPASVTVPGGTSSRTFTVTTSSVASSTTVRITGSSGGVTRSATLTVRPPTTTTLAAPALRSPAADARFTRGQTITFDWTDVTGAAGYLIQIDDQSSFSSPTVARSVTSSTYSVSTLPAARMWFRVRATDASGTAGAWSASRRFEVG